MEEQLLSIQEAAEKLKVSTKTLRRWESRNILVPQRTKGEHRRYTKSQIDNFYIHSTENFNNNEELHSNFSEKKIDPATEGIAANPFETYEGFTIYQKEETTADSSIPGDFTPKITTEHIEKKNIFKSLDLSRFSTTIKKPNLSTLLSIGLPSFPALKLPTFPSLAHSSSKRIILATGIASFVSLSSLFLLFNVFAVDFGLITTSNKANPQELQRVLGEETETPTFALDINVPSTFGKLATFLEGINVQGIATFSGGIDLGTGTITASNVLYGVTAGSGIGITTGQTPTISNTGVISLGGSTGALTLTAGTGITIDGLKITNSATTPNLFKTITTGSDSFSAGSSTDTLEFVGGTGVTIVSDTTNKKLTFSASLSAAGGWTDGGTSVYLSTITDNLGVGTTTPSTKLDVAGTFNVTDAATFSSLSTGIAHFSALGLLSSSALNLAEGSDEVTGLLPALNGGTGIDGSLAGNGTLLIGNGTGYSLANLTAGSGISIGNSAGGITISQTGGGASKFIQDDTLGILTPHISTLDVLLGGTSTSSAKFGFLNNAGGTPIATISANSGDNATYLTGNGTLATTNRGTLTLGNSSAYNTTGNILLNPNGTGNVGIGTTNPGATLDVLGTSIMTAAVANSTTLTLMAAPSGSANILNITDNTGGTSYFSIDSSGQLSGSAFRLTDINNAVVGTAIEGGWTLGVNTFTYRRSVTVNNTNGTTLPVNYEVTVSLSGASAAQVYNNSQADYDDVRLSYNGTEIAKNVTSFTSSSVVFTFQLQSAISASSSDANYYMYYKNPSLATAGATYVGNIAIESADATTDWSTSDSIQFPIAIETSSPAPQEGTGSLSLTATVDNIGTLSTTSQGQLSGARTNFGFDSPSISGTRYLYVVGGSTDGTAGNAQTTILRTSITAATGNVGTWTTNGNSLSSAVMDNSVSVAAPPIDGGTGADGAIDLSNGSGAGGCTGTGLSWTAGTSTCTIATATKSTFNFTTVTIPAGTTLTTDGPQTTSNLVTIKATGNVSIAGTINLNGKGYSAQNGPGVGGTATQCCTLGGGGGGGYGGAGGYGGGGVTFRGAGGTTYSTLDSGSGGGNTRISTVGGAGGGGIKIISSGTISTTSTGSISANGATGAAGAGGGSGGAIWLSGSTVTLNSGSTLSANGGNGGNGIGGETNQLDGGGGGGGRITLEYNSVSNSATVTVTKGNRGTTFSPDATDGTIGVSTSSDITPFMYVLGGKNTSGTAQSGISKATITTSDGSVGAFSASATSLPQALFGHVSKALTINSSNYLYIIGGNNGTSDQTTVYKGTFNSDGTIAAISTTSQAQLGTGISYPAIANVSISSTNYIYVVGGLNGSTAQTSVYKGTLDSSGNITALTTASQGTLPVALYGASAFVGTVGSNNYLFVIGGKTTGDTRQTVVYKASIDASGNVGSFTNATVGQTQLSTAMSDHASFTFTDDSSNQYAYVIGGNTAGSSGLTTVYKTLYSPIDQTTYSVTKTLSSSVNLSNKNDIQFKVFTPSSGGRTGQYLKFQISEDNVTYRNCDNSGDFNASSVMNITTSGSWQTITCGTTGLTSTQKDAVLYLKYIVNSSSSSQWLLYIDDIDGLTNASTISNSVSGGSAVLGSADLSLNAQGAGAVNINYDAASGLAGSGGLKIFDGAAGLLFNLDSTGNASASGALYLTGASSSASLNILNGQNFAFKTSVGGDAGLLTRMTLLNNGRFGIGTTSPLATLDVTGILGTIPTASISAQSSFAALVVDNTIGDLFTASSSGLSRFVVKQSGNIGIGTTTPLALLDVNGTASISGALKLYGTPTIQSTANQTLTLGGDTTGNILLMPRNGSGYVGIGTTSPSQLFSVGTGASSNFTVTSAGAVTAASTINSQTISSAANFTGTLGVATSITSPIIYGGSGTTSTLSLRPTSGSGTTGSDIIFGVGSAGSTEAMRILNNGNVGIGTNAPTNILSLGNLQNQKIWIETTNSVVSGKALTLAAGSTTNTSSAGFLALGQTSRSWNAMAAAPNGDVYAVVVNGDIYKQTGGTGDFVALGQTSRVWRGVAAAPNGDVYASEQSGDIYKQTGGTGNFVALGQTSRVWWSMAAAPNGDVYAAVSNGDIYKQTGGTGNFVALSQTSRSWYGMAAAPNGDIYSAEYGGDIYKQTGGTGNFVALSQTSRNWRGIAAAPNGDVYAVVYSGDIYKQTGGTGNFVALSQTSRFWNGVAADPDGNVYAADGGGDIYLQASAEGTADLAGGNLILSSGAGKGTGASTISFNTGTTLTTGTALQTLATKMTILGNGNVGIATTNPSARFEVSDLAAGNLGGIYVSNGGRVITKKAIAGNYVQFGLLNEGAIGSESGWRLAMPSDSNDLVFESTTNSYTGVTERLRFASGGIGIGTTSPLASLDIKDTSSLATLGSEKITSSSDDRDFTTDTGKWTTSGSPAWKIDIANSDLAEKDAPGDSGVLTLSNTALDSAPVSGNTYKITFTVTTTSSSSGSLSFAFGGTNGVSVGHGTNFSSTQTQVVTATTTDPLTFTPTMDWYGTIDDVSIMQITNSSIALRLEASDGTGTPIEFRTGGSSANNLFIGGTSGRNNISGTSNTGVGYLSLRNNTVGNNNSGFGERTLSNNTTGSYNSAVGSYALYSNTTGGSNTGMGDSALWQNTTGYQNSAFGESTLYNNTTGYYNAAAGNSALYSNTTGYSNNGMGGTALYANTTGYLNSALGDSALYANTTGSGNSAFGAQALLNLDITANDGTGNNTAVGYNTGLGIVTGVNNTILGANVTGLASGLSNNIIIADGAGNRRINVDSNGLVGIGTTGPAFRLDIQDSQAATAAARIYNTNSGTGTVGQIIGLGYTGNGTAVSGMGTGNRFVQFQNGLGLAVGNISSNGSGGVAYDTGGADYAEYFRKEDVGETFEPGDLVCTGVNGGVTKCIDSGASSILGVISNSAGFVGGSNHAGDTNYVLVGLVGQLGVKVTGEVKPSDFLTVSDVAGYAKVATGSSFVLGRVLEKDIVNGRILSSLQPTWHMTGIAFNNGSNSITTDTLVAKTVKADNIDLPSNWLEEALQTGGPTFIDGRIQEFATTSAIFDQIQTNFADLNSKIDENNKTIASLSAQLDKLKGIENLSLVTLASNSGDIVTITDNLSVFGAATFNQASVLSNLSINNNLNLTENSISTVGEDLQIQPLAQGGVNFLGGLITIDTEGNLKVGGNAEFAKDVTVKGVLSAKTTEVIADTLPVIISNTEVTASASAGTLTLKLGETILKVNNSRVKDDSLIFVTPKGSTGGLPIYIKEQTAGESFTVGIDTALSKDIEFNYQVVNIKR